MRSTCSTTAAASGSCARPAARADASTAPAACSRPRSRPASRSGTTWTMRWRRPSATSRSRSRRRPRSATRTSPAAARAGCRSCRDSPRSALLIAAWLRHQPERERMREVVHDEVAPVLGGHRVRHGRGVVGRRLGAHALELLAEDADADVGCGDVLLDPSRGARVAAVDRHLAGAEETAAAIRAGGGTARAYACDVADSAEVAAAAQATLRDLGPVDVLANVAGIGDAVGSDITELDDARWNHV